MILSIPREIGENSMKKAKELPKKIKSIEKKSLNKICSVILAVLAILCFFYCLSIALFMGYGTTFFLIWGAAAVFFGLWSVVLTSPKLVRSIPRWFKVIFGTFLTIGCLLFFIVEGMILGEFGAKPEQGADYVIVLGAQWKQNGPSYILQKRLDAAVTYLKENEDTLVIVSGGQGSNEHITEASGMCSYLVEKGINKERILVEDKSTNTYENLVFSGEFLNKAEDSVVLVTNNFHMFRALQIAEKQGYENIEGLAAGSYPAMVPNNLLREFLGVIKDFAVGNL
jgi:uncharacterized SAM-binding protein YcdF (DUF218 family)